MNKPETYTSGSACVHSSHPKKLTLFLLTSILSGIIIFFGGGALLHSKMMTTHALLHMLNKEDKNARK